MESGKSRGTCFERVRALEIRRSPRDRSPPSPNSMDFVSDRQARVARGLQHLDHEACASPAMPTPLRKFRWVLRVCRRLVSGVVGRERERERERVF